MNTERITNILNNFLDQFGLTCFCGTDYNYYYNTDEIEYCVVTTERYDRLWKQYLTNRYGNELDVDFFPIFIWSFLHEVGHSQTNMLFSGEGRALLDEYKNSLDGSSDEDTLYYFSAPDENIATYWAFDYIRNNREEVITLCIELAEAFEEFYKENDLR